MRKKAPHIVFELVKRANARSKAVKKKQREFAKGIYGTPKYNRWRTAVFYRDSHECQLCGREDYIEAHHIMKKSKYPKRIFDVDNGITLCGPCTDRTSCHGKITGKEKEWEEVLFRILKRKKRGIH